MKASISHAFLSITKMELPVARKSEIPGLLLQFRGPRQYLYALRRGSCSNQRDIESTRKELVRFLKYKTFPYSHF